MTEDDLTELMMSMSGTASATYDSNLQKLGYADFAKPSEIDIYPKDFESKEQVVDYLDRYNKKMEKAGKDEQVISYTDVVGTLMSSVTDIIRILLKKEPSSSSAADGLTGSKAFSGWVTVSSSFTKGWKPVPCHGQEPVKKPQTLPRSSSGIL